MSYSGQAAHAPGIPRFPGAVAASHDPLFRNQGDEGLSALETLGTVSRYGRNEIIFSEGEELQYTYRIVRGAVRLSRITNDGRRQIVEFRMAGDFIGFEWEGQFALTGEAVREVVAVRFARVRVDRLLKERQDVRDRVSALIREELCVAHEHIVTLGFQSAKERVANFLLQMARRARAGDGDVVEIELGRQDIADYLGLTLETVSRTLSVFKRAGAIGLPQRRQIVVRSKSMLRTQKISIN